MADESIYNLIPQPVAEPVKPPMYKSKHAPNKPPTFSTFGLTGTSKPGYSNVGGDSTGGEASGYGVHSYRKAAATFGKDGGATRPTDVLQKGTGYGGGAVSLAAPGQATKFGYTATTHKKPAVPTAAELAADAAARPVRETKNFVTSNAVENILSQPTRKPEPIDWTAKPCFGKVPGYLNKIKKEIADEYEYIRSMQMAEEEAGPAGMRLLPDGQRLALIDSLKAKWDEVNGTYQKSSVLSLASLDTIGKVKRKEMYEAQLAQIERDIEKLSKDQVYVASDELY
jgi:hypothetical protein